MSEIQRYFTNRTGKERLGVLNENKILSIESSFVTAINNVIKKYYIKKSGVISNA